MDLLDPKHRCSPFTRFATATARISGRPVTFITAVLVVAAWAACGPMFKFSDTWQLVINTSTTIVTFLMVFLIQNTQNRDSAAIHLKLDELIRATKAADNTLLDLEELDGTELDAMRRDYETLADRARATPRKTRIAHVAKAAEGSAHLQQTNGEH